MSRLRVRFTKLGKIRFTSHRDVARMFERAFRRAEVPLAYTEGFSPRPRISFGLALSTGYESLAEYLDADLVDDVAGASVDEPALPLRLSAALPTGIDVVAVAPVDGHAPSLQQDVTSTTWRLTIVGADRDAVEAAAHDAMGAATIMATRTRKGQESIDDLRPSLLALHLDPESRAGRRRHVRRRARRPNLGPCAPPSSSARCGQLSMTCARCARTNGSSATARDGSLSHPTHRRRASSEGNPPMSEPMPSDAVLPSEPPAESPVSRASAAAGDEPGDGTPATSVRKKRRRGSRGGRNRQRSNADSVEPRASGRR